MDIYGYSERGIINSMAYFLNENPKFINDFIKILGVPLEDSDYEYKILIEQSFSDFGDSDLIIIIKDKVNEKKKVIFIECKIKTYQGAFQINSEFNKINNAIKSNKKISGISSNLFVQLYYKYLLINTDGNSSNDHSVKDIFKKSNGNPRILGSNKIVLRAFDEIRSSDYYYVAIVSTAPNEMGSKEFEKKIRTLGLMLLNHNVFLCYWGNLEDYFKKINATKVLEVFKYNEGQIY
jgi:hypothetical protein